MDWEFYRLHRFMAADPSRWLRRVNGSTVEIAGQNVFDFTRDDVSRSSMHLCHVHLLACDSSLQVQQAFLGVLRNASLSGVIDGAFLDRGDQNTSATTWSTSCGCHGCLTIRAGRGVDANKAKEWNAAHHAIVQQVQATVFPEGVVVSNNFDYSDVSARMFERAFVSDYDGNTPEQDIAAIQHEAVMGHVVEVKDWIVAGLFTPIEHQVHGEPVNTQLPGGRCDDYTFNVTLASFLVAAGEYAYYSCTQGDACVPSTLHGMLLQDGTQRPDGSNGIENMTCLWVHRTVQQSKR